LRSAQDPAGLLRRSGVEGDPIGIALAEQAKRTTTGQSADGASLPLWLRPSLSPTLTVGQPGVSPS